MKLLHKYFLILRKNHIILIKLMFQKYDKTIFSLSKTYLKLILDKKYHFYAIEKTRFSLYLLGFPSLFTTTLFIFFT